MVYLSLRLCSRSCAISKPIIGFKQKLTFISSRNVSRSIPRRNFCFCARPIEPSGLTSSCSTLENQVLDDSPLSGTFPTLQLHQTFQSFIHTHICNVSVLYKQVCEGVTQLWLSFDVGMEGVLVSYLFGKRRATEVAHS